MATQCKMYYIKLLPVFASGHTLVCIDGYTCKFPDFAVQQRIITVDNLSTNSLSISPVVLEIKAPYGFQEKRLVTV